MCRVQEDRLLDLIMLQLRLSDGLDLQQLQQQFGQPVVTALLPVIHDMMQKELMQLLPYRLQQPATAPAAWPAQHTTLLEQRQETAADERGSSSRQAAAAAVEQPAQQCELLDAQCGVDALQERLQLGLPCGVQLTDPRGFLLSNDVIAELFAVLEPSMLPGAEVQQLG
jgi:hypothetical protein